jgi:hypothetical protein
MVWPQSSQGKIKINNPNGIPLPEYVVRFLINVKESGEGKVWMGGQHFVIHVGDKIRYVDSKIHENENNWTWSRKKICFRVMLFKISDDEYNIIDIFSLPDNQIYYDNYWKSVNGEAAGPNYHWHCYDQGKGGKPKKKDQKEFILIK